MTIDTAPDELPDLLRGAELFEDVAAQALSELVLTATELTVAPGETVLEEGTLGEEFFIVAAGSLHVVGRAFDGTELILARLERGRIFGEQSLIADTPVRRNASIRALTRCRLFAFPRSALRRLQSESPDISARIGTVAIGQGAARDTRFRDAVLKDLGIGSDYAIERFPAGSFVFRQGDRGDRVYLIVSGAAEVTRTDDGHERVVADLQPGQFFGELAVLNDVPRAASIRAVSDMLVACLEAAWIRSAVAVNPRLRSIFGALQAMYLLPARGLVTLQGGKLGSEPTLTTTHHLADGRLVVSTRLTEMDAFTARIVNAPEASATAQYRSDDGERMRVIHVADDRLVEIEAEGQWERLGDVLAALLDGAPITHGDLASFRATGDFGAPPMPERAAAEIVCRCTGVTAGQITAAIQSGCGTLEEVGARTTATLICGGCIPIVKEFLGEGEWCPGVCDHAVSLGDDIRAFRLRWLREAPLKILPGQHVVVQGRIDGHWVERPYTLTAPVADGRSEIIVKREPSGLMSPWLFDALDAGTALRLSPPRGSFLLDFETGGSIVFLAGGIGITPALALARHATSGDLARATTSRLHIDYSERADDRFIGGAELQDLAARHPWFTVTLRNTRRMGRLGSRDAAALAERFADARFVLCGSDRYVLGARALLVDAGIDPARVLSESFTPVALAPRQAALQA